MTDVIRVDPNLLHYYAGQITGVAQSLRQVGLDVSASTSGAPSYDGQFGPRVSSIGLEGAARSQAIADRLDALAAHLRTKADEFIQADLAAEAAMMGAPPPQGIDLSNIEIPWWVIALLGIVPFGDAIGLLEELVNSLSGRGVSQINLWLSIFGLAADAGYLDLFVPDPVDGVNVGLAGIKAAVRTLGHLPPSAEKILLESLQAAVKNPDDIARVANVLTTMAQNSDVARRILADDDALRALLRSNNASELLEGFARNGDEFLGRINPAQAARVSDLSQQYGVDIHVAGKLADTQAEAAFRRQLAEQAEELARTENISYLEAQFRVAERNGVDFFQVKASSPGDIIKDVDVFIDMDQWAKLTLDQQKEIRTAMGEAFGVDPANVDFYQTLDAVDPVASGLPPGRYNIPDPQHNVPPSSIHFGPNGAVDHAPLISSGATP